ncbi:hypothetical protein [Roseomonas mucosa]|uniref:hypothetical protein n=1 Tax=Roseomonas mucosa TaxID=207340 RepID=UPI0011158EE2|nr:hypothetical protein [Roseomonas mucosa]
MQYLKGAHQQVASVPIAEFDASSPIAGVYLLALLTWPKNRRKQQHALVTYAAELIAYCQARPASLMASLFKFTVQTVAEKLGVPEAEVLSMPHARTIAEAMATGDAHNLRGYIEEELLIPAGGFQALAEAPGSAVLRSEADAVLNGPVKNAGRTLLLIAAMVHHHPEIPASLNRAFAIMEGDANAVRRSGVTTRTLRAHWADWRGIAPLAAALWVWNMQCPPGSNEKEHLADAFASEEGVRALLGWAVWFRQFGVSFAPSRGQSTILPETEAVLYRAGGQAILPPLPPLSIEELQDAAAYQAPTNKFR